VTKDEQEGEKKGNGSQMGMVKANDPLMAKHSAI
jgi:hypothetical protein